MNKREIFFIVSLACLGIFILLGVYLWKENYASKKTVEFNKESYAGQAEDPRNGEKAAGAARTGQTQPAGSVPAAKNTGTAATTGKGQDQPANPEAGANPGSVPGPPSSPSLQAAAKINSIIASGSKVGDIIKFGDVEMVVTKSTARHKIIDITLKGNTSEQPPKLILSKDNRIIYEIPADVDINVNVTEKTVIDKSPPFYGGEKAGK